MARCTYCAGLKRSIYGLKQASEFLGIFNLTGRSKASALISVSLNIVYWKRDGSKVVFLVINDDDKLLIGNG